MLDPLCMVPGFIMQYMCTDTFILADIIHVVRITAEFESEGWGTGVTLMTQRSILGFEKLGVICYEKCAV